MHFEKVDALLNLNYLTINKSNTNLYMFLKLKEFWINQA